MTRINVIPPERLSDKHLVAEYRELPRIFNLVRRAISRGLRACSADIPDSYRLGTGHVKFFYDKLGYLEARQYSLIQEMQNRGMNPQYTDIDITDIGQEWKKYWTPTKEAVRLNIERINVRGGLRK